MNTTKLIMAVAVLVLAACNSDDTTNNYYTQPTTRIVFGGPDRPAALASVEAYSLQGVERMGISVVEVPADQAETIIQDLAADPTVRFVEIDRLVYPDFVPDDPGYSDQYYLPMINAPEAWDVTHGDGVIVAILDTGVDVNHPDLFGKVLPGLNAVDLSSDTTDVHGHGTAVSGAVAAASNNGVHIASIAFSAQVLPVKVSNLESGGAYWSDISRGLVWACENGADFANISYGAYTSRAVAEAAEYCRSLGTLTFSSAGNAGHGEDSCNFVQPPLVPSMLIVSATDATDSLASWSSCGDYVDLSAPGSRILALRNGGGTRTVNGTSFSSPLSAGVAALVKSANPFLSVDEIQHVVLSTAVDLGLPGQDERYGHGRVDAAAAVRLAMDMRYEQPEPEPEPEPQPEPVPDPTIAVDILSPDDWSVVSDRFDVRMVATSESPVRIYRCYMGDDLARQRIYPRDKSGNTVVCGISSRLWPNGIYTVTAEVEDDTGATAAAYVTVLVQN